MAFYRNLSEDTR